MPAVRTVGGGVVMGLCDGRALAGQDLWFSDVPAEREEATRLCRRCPGRDACLRGALERHEPAGIWAGRSFDPVDETTAALTGEPAATVRVSVFAPMHGENRFYDRCKAGEDGRACPACRAAHADHVSRWRSTHSPAPVRPVVDLPQLQFAF